MYSDHTVYCEGSLCLNGTIPANFADLWSVTVNGSLWLGHRGYSLKPEAGERGPPASSCFHRLVSDRWFLQWSGLLAAGPVVWQ